MGGRDRDRFLPASLSLCALFVCNGRGLERGEGFIKVGRGDVGDEPGDRLWTGGEKVVGLGSIGGEKRKRKGN